MFFLTYFGNGSAKKNCFSSKMQRVLGRGMSHIYFSTFLVFISLCGLYRLCVLEYSCVCLMCIVSYISTSYPYIMSFLVKRKDNVFSFGSNICVVMSCEINLYDTSEQLRCTIDRRIQSVQHYTGWLLYISLCMGGVGVSS